MHYSISSYVGKKPTGCLRDIIFRRDEETRQVKTEISALAQVQINAHRQTVGNEGNQSGNVGGPGTLRSGCIYRWRFGGVRLKSINQVIL